MKAGDFATLVCPYKGYRNIELIKRLPYTWLVRIVSIQQTPYCENC